MYILERVYKKSIGERFLFYLAVRKFPTFATSQREICCTVIFFLSLFFFGSLQFDSIREVVIRSSVRVY